MVWPQEETTIWVDARDTQVFVLGGRGGRGDELNKRAHSRKSVKAGMIDR